MIALFDRMMEQDLDDPQVPMLYAQYLLSKSMEAEAVPVLEQVVDLDPTNKGCPSYADKCGDKEGRL